MNHLLLGINSFLGFTGQRMLVNPESEFLICIDGDHGFGDLEIAIDSRESSKSFENGECCLNEEPIFFFHWK